MIVGVILAGGAARRMGGGDKPLRSLGGRPLLGRLVGRLRPQVDGLAINANSGPGDDPARFDAYGLPVLPDTEPDRPGPLAGVLAGLDWAASLGSVWLLTAPGDAPFLPKDFALRLLAERGEHAYVAASSGGRLHPVAALWPITAREPIRQALRGGRRRVDALAGAELARVEWPTYPLDPFFNVNTPEDLAEAERLAAAWPDS